MSRSAQFVSLFIILAYVSIVLGVKNSNLRSLNASRNVVKNLKVSDIDSSSAKISWSVTEDSVSPTNSFTIEVLRNGDPVKRQTISGATSWLARDLEPCTRYDVAITSSADADKVHTEFTTSYVTPVWSMKHGAITMKPSGLKLVWTSAEPASCVKSYRIEVSTRDPNLEHSLIAETLATVYVFDNLYACANYWYTVSLIDHQNNVFQSIEGQAVRQFTVVPTAPVTSDKTETLLTRYTATFYLNARSPTSNCSLDTIRTQCEVTSSPVAGEQGKLYELQSRVRPGQDYENIPVSLERLTPYTYFSCRAAGVNGAGVGPQSRPITFRTAEDYPFPPYRLRGERGQLVWEPPRWLAGSLIGYRLRLAWSRNYPIPQGCPGAEVGQRTRTIEVEPSSTRLTLEDEESSARYIVKMASRTGLGYSHETVIDYTSPVHGVPDKITNLSYNIVPVSYPVKAYNVTLTWNLPCSPKGNLREFEVEAKDGSGQIVANPNVLLPEARVQPNRQFRAVLSQLRAADTYSVAITPVLRDSEVNDGRGEVTAITIQIPAWSRTTDNS